MLPQKILRTPAAAEYCGLSASTFEKMRLTGAGPTFRRLTKRAIGYDVADLDTWLSQHSRHSTSDHGGRDA